MSIKLESGIAGGLSKEEFRDTFIENIPVGTIVKNIIMFSPQGNYFYARTEEGGIYDNEDSLDVNVGYINGNPGLSGVWTAGNVVRAEQYWID